MGRNRYRVLEVSGIRSISRYRYRRKIRYRYQVLFDTISILYMHVYYKIKLDCTMELNITVPYAIHRVRARYYKVL